MNPTCVAEVAASFHDPTDGAAMKSQELILLLLRSSPAPFSRDHFTPGHITCTGLVFAPDGERVLLVHHRRLDRWLLPGGHVEPEDVQIWDAARREVIEETGAVLVPDATPHLAGMDVHGIPSNGREPYHLHHDLLFRFDASSEATQVSAESHEIAWCGPAEFDRHAVPENIVRAYRRVVTSR